MPAPADDLDFDPEVAEPGLSSEAWARIGLIFAVATVLVITGLEGWSSLAWLGGAGLLVGLAIIRKGYWHPKIMAQITTAAGALGALGIIALLVAFNLLLSAAFLGGGVLLGILWRIIS